MKKSLLREEERLTCIYPLLTQQFGRLYYLYNVSIPNNSHTQPVDTCRQQGTQDTWKDSWVGANDMHPLYKYFPAYVLFHNRREFQWFGTWSGGWRRWTNCRVWNNKAIPPTLADRLAIGWIVWGGQQQSFVFASCCHHQECRVFFLFLIKTEPQPEAVISSGKPPS